jgi:hypothetical protein
MEKYTVFLLMVLPFISVKYDRDYMVRSEVAVLFANNKMFDF